MDAAQFRGIRSISNSSFLEMVYQMLTFFSGLVFWTLFYNWRGDLFLQRSFEPNLTMEILYTGKATLGITWVPALAIYSGLW